MWLVILVPVLGRPHRAAPLVESLRRSGALDYRLLFLVSPGDDEERRACEETGADVLEVPWEAGPGDYAKKINYGYRSTTEPWLFLGADDLCFCEGWDIAALSMALDTGAGVVGTDDLFNPKVRKGEHSTHTFVRRSYIDDVGGAWDGPGFIYHEGYDHQYVDTELVEAAKRRGEWAFAHKSRVEHLHVFAGKSDTDSTYQKALRAGEADRRLYRQREAMNR